MNGQTETRTRPWILFVCLFNNNLVNIGKQSTKCMANNVCLFSQTVKSYSVGQ